MSALWSLGMFFDMKIPLDHEDYVEFSKLQDRIVGTQGEVATVRFFCDKNVFFFLFFSSIVLVGENLKSFSVEFPANLTEFALRVNTRPWGQLFIFVQAVIN